MRTSKYGIFKGLSVFSAVIVAVILAGVSGGARAGLGDLFTGNREKNPEASRSYPLEGFDRLDVAGVYEIEVVMGRDFFIAISGPESELARMEVTVKNGTLVLDQEESFFGLRLRRLGLTARISMPALAGLDVSGVIDGSITGIRSDAFAVELSGVGDLRLSGECGALTARISGVGDLDARELHCESVKVRVSGIGDASVHASEAVDAAASGIGDIRIYGDPAMVLKNGGLLSDISIH